MGREDHTRHLSSFDSNLALELTLLELRARFDSQDDDSEELLWNDGDAKSTTEVKQVFNQDKKIDIEIFHIFLSRWGRDYEVLDSHS